MAGVIGTALAVFVLGRLPFVVVDDSGLAHRTGFTRTSHPARTGDTPVLAADRPWEAGRVYLYGTVVHDAAGGFRMWYGSRPALERGVRQSGPVPRLPGGGTRLVLYAVSSDGRHWLKPNLGLFGYGDIRGTNIVYGLDSPSVLIDRSAPNAAERYKMLGALDGNYYAATSPDGLRWSAVGRGPALRYSDTITLAQDPSTGEYLAYHKRPARIRGYPRRAVWLSRSRDFRSWSAPVLVLSPDEEDDAWVTRPAQRTEIYDLSAYPYANGFVGLAAVLRVMTERPVAQLTAGQSPLDGPVDVELASSPDGTRWRRSPKRNALIPRGRPGAFDAGAILGVASHPVDIGGETWVYYTGINTGHGGPIPPKRLAIGLATWRLDGFVSLDASAAGGRLETQPMRFASPHLIVNADASRGHLRVGLLEVDGRPVRDRELADCEPMASNRTDWTARWRAGETVPTDRPVRVLLEAVNAQVYSLASDARRPR